MPDAGPDSPLDVVDRLLWRGAQQVLQRHAAVDLIGRCTWCGQVWPCPPHQLGQRAELAAQQPAPATAPAATAEAEVQTAVQAERHVEVRAEVPDGTQDVAFAPARVTTATSTAAATATAGTTGTAGAAVLVVDRKAGARSGWRWRSANRRTF